MDLLLLVLCIHIENECMNAGHPMQLAHTHTHIDPIIPIAPKRVFPLFSFLSHSAILEYRH
jgi:hypothetical protein